MNEDTIWVGLDVHAESISLARVVNGGQKPVTSEIRNDPKLVRRTFERLKKQGAVVCCYEAGPCGFDLCRQLRDMGVSCTVIAPSLIPKKAGDRVKTDRRDAVKLCRLLRAGELTPIWVPDEEQEAARDLLRAREDARTDRTRARQRLSKFLLRHGHRYDGGTAWTGKYWTWVRGLRFERHGERVAFEHYVEQIQYLDGRMAALDEEISQLADSDGYRQRVHRLSCLRGISTLTAMIVLTELFDLARFAHPRDLMAYLGLVPSEHSSGSSTRRGPITKTGNGRVRRVLVESAWSYRRRPSLTTRQHRILADQPPEVAELARKATRRLGKRFARLEGRGKRSQVACTAVARELCGFVWALGTLEVST